MQTLREKAQAAAYRVAQEALHNALRHAGPGQVSLTLSRARGRVVLEVQNVDLTAGTKELLHGVDFPLERGEHVMSSGGRMACVRMRKALPS